MRYFRPKADFPKNPQKPCQVGRALSPKAPQVVLASGFAARSASAPYLTGFTLPEMLVVIVIIGILATMLGHGVITAQRQARQTHCKSNLRQFGVALQIYRGDHNSYCHRYYFRLLKY